MAKRYPTRHGLLHAVDGVDLKIGRGESLGLVGESGCGKSTLVRLLARLIEPSEGAIVFDGRDIAPIPLDRFVRSPARARIQSVFQDPTESLNPALTVFDAVADLRTRLGMSYLFVSHDLNVVSLLCSRIAVMYLGRIVEQAPAAELFRDPRHPYTRSLLASIPDPARRGEWPLRPDGSARSPIDPSPHVCRFEGRCPRQEAVCAERMPLLLPTTPDHLVACHFAEETAFVAAGSAPAARPAH